MSEPISLHPDIVNSRNVHVKRSSEKDIFHTEKNGRKRKTPGKKITLREKEVLLLLSNGDSSKIIAQKLNISETTAITHRKNLIHKFQVKNTAHLIKVAYLFRII